MYNRQVIENDWGKLAPGDEAYYWLCGVVRSGLIIVWLQKNGHLPFLGLLGRVTVWEAGAGHEAWGLKQMGAKMVTAIDNASGSFSDSYYKRNDVFCEDILYEEVSIRDWLVARPDESESLICAFGSAPNVIFSHRGGFVAREIGRVLRVGGKLLLEGDELAVCADLGDDFLVEYFCPDLTKVELPGHLCDLRYSVLTVERVVATSLGNIRLSLATKIK